MLSRKKKWWLTEEPITIALRARVVDGTLHSANVLEPLATHSGRKETPKQVGF